jgi:hypothetical protein
LGKADAKAHLVEFSIEPDHKLRFEAGEARIAQVALDHHELHEVEKLKGIERETLRCD